MDKLFEIYVRRLISRDFFEKVYNFLNEIKNDTDIVELGRMKIKVFDRKKGIHNQRFQMTMKYKSKDHIEIKPGSYFPLLSDYFKSSMFFVPSKSSGITDTITFNLSDIEKFIDNINLSKEDYDMFLDSKRFGL